MPHIHSQSMPPDRDEKPQRFYTGSPPEVEKHVITLNGSAGHPRRLEPHTRIFRASEILLPAEEKSVNGMPDMLTGVESLQDTLRIFPPFQDDDGAVLSSVDINCPDCDAVFSTSDELQQHYLTKYCPGAAVAVYMMTRDPLITKGYRMEKRFIPLHCRLLRFFCTGCERPFAMNNGEVVPRQKDAPSLINCTHCGQEYNILYEPNMKETHDESNPREPTNDIPNGGHSKRPSVTKFPVGQSPENEQSLAKKARKSRNSWSFRKLPQGDEDELVAVSFSSLEDLEKVHAPNGIFRQPQRTGEPPRNQQADVVKANATPDHDEKPTTNSRQSTAFCEDNCPVNGLGGSGDSLDGQKPPSTRRQSMFQKIFGRKISKGLSRTSSTSYDSRRSVKRAGSLRFSSVSNSLSNTRAATAMSERTLYGVQEQNEGQSVQVETPARDLEPDSSVSPNGSREVSIHMQIIHGGVIVHDASGRQRMLQMNEITQLLSQLKDELAAAPTWGEIVAVRLRAESALRIGNLKSATVDLQGALRMLQDSPSLGVDKISRAAMLYSLGQAYQNLDMLTEAESCYLESLGLYKRSLGRDHHKNFAILQNLGDVCQKRGHTIEATCLYERAFTGRLKMLGQNDPDTLSSMQELALLKSSLGHSESALFLLENAVPALESVFGLQNEKTLTAMDKLSLLYQKLGHEPEAHDICSRAIPPCKTFFGVDGTMTRELVVRYFQTSGNFDFPAEVKDIIDQYRQSRNPDSLRVVHRLARSYMDGGLNRDASELFQSLYEDFLVVKGPDAPETFDALSALCVSREHLDGIEQAIHAYSNLITLASKTPEGHHSRKRVGYAEKRIKELNRRRDILAAERKDWGLQEPGECINCGSSTTDLCSTCKIARFCSESCHKHALPCHRAYCLPSVSLRESKSLAVKPKCATPIREEVLGRIPSPSPSSSPPPTKPTKPRVTASYTFYLDPRNFTTFRMKLNTSVNTTILFSASSDIQYTTITDTTSFDMDPDPASLGATIQSPTASSTSVVPPKKFHWTTPAIQDSITHTASPTPAPLPESGSEPGTETPGSTYLIVAPGEEMLKSLAEKRISVRQGGGEGTRFQDLEFPNPGLIEYAQGLLLSGYEGKVFMYVVEWR